MYTYPLFGSDLLKSRRSAITVNATRNARPSSSSKPKCDGPMTICLTGVFNDCNACGLCVPYLLILSATSRILWMNKTIEEKRRRRNEKQTFEYHDLKYYTVKMKITHFDTSYHLCNEMKLNLIHLFALRLELMRYFWFFENLNKMYFAIVLFFFCC